MTIHLNRYFTNRWRTLIFFSLVGAVLIIFFRITPDVMKIIEIQKQLHKSKLRIREAIRVEQNLGQIEQRQQEIKKQIENTVFDENQETQLSTILQQISRAASAEEVRVERMKPGVVERKPTHVELPLELDVSCRYHPIGRFLNRLETSQPVMKVKTVAIQAESIVSSRLDARIHVLVFYLEQRP